MRSAFLCVLSAAAGSALASSAMVSPAAASPGGSLGTLHHGTYVCSLPGDAAGPARRVVEGETFVIADSSTYSTDDGWGTYLLTGKRVVFSRGPMKGAAYLRESRSTLRKLDEAGRATDLRCTRWAKRA